MENIELWWAAFQESFSQSVAGIGAYLPVVAAAVAVMLGGWLVASVARAILLRSGGTVNELISRWGRPLSAARQQMSRRLVLLAASLAFWMVILIAAAIAARVAGLEAFSIWLDRVVDYLPTLVAGVLITLAGYLLSALVRDVVSTALVSVGSKEHENAGLAAQVAVFVTALVIGLDQIGIDVTFLIILVAVLLAGVSLSLAFAFGFGAKDFVGNLIAARQLRGVLEPGDFARIGGVAGRVLEVTATAIVLTNDDGRVLVPAALFQTTTIEVSEDGTSE